MNHMLLGFRNDYGIVEYLQPLGVKDIEIHAVDQLIEKTFESIECIFRKHGVLVRLYHFSKNSVHLFDEQSPKIGRMTIGNNHHLGLSSWILVFLAMFISSIILLRRRKSNGVHLPIFNINFFPIGLRINSHRK